MQNPKLILFFLLVVCISCDPKIKPESLVGYWQSDTDSKSLLKIDGKEMTFVYDGATEGSTTYNFSAKCPTACNNTDKACIVTQGENGTECYAIMQADGKKLAMFFTGGNGRIKADNTYQVDFGIDGVAEVKGKITFDGNKMTIQDTGGEMACMGENTKGVYTYSVDASSLTMTKVSDGCQGRGATDKMVFSKM